MSLYLQCLRALWGSAASGGGGVGSHRPKVRDLIGLVP